MKANSAFLIVIILFGCIAATYSQHTINGSINGLKNTKVYLLQVKGQSKSTLDTAFCNNEGSFTFNLNQDLPVGMYTINTGTNQNIELIYNNENIRFVSSGNSAEDNVQIVESIENLIWYDYLYTKGFNQYKMEVIEQLLMSYPPGDKYYEYTENYYQNLQTNISSRSKELITNNPNTLASRYIKVDMPVFAPYGLSENDKQKYLIEHHFDNTDFSDTLLLRSNILSSKVIKYLSLYQSPSYTKQTLEDELIVAIDSVLNYAIVEQKTYEWLVDFLLKGFEAIGFERGLNHIAEQNKLSELCVNTDRKQSLERRMEMIKKLAIGKKSPDFTTKDISGDEINLYNINSEKTILIFWASWCPHCTEVLPVLKEYYERESREKLEVIAVSIDEYESDLMNYLKDNPYEWINIAEFKGWDGPTAVKYDVHATPTIFVLDKDKNIVAKPTNKAGIKKVLDN
ncbi:MAG: hypothetical protein C0598_00480 [Marinilabiliales bacterium]|nr:MAG: hypothetical protein C0598_00480 [Marinilabiliales bacterium]